MIVCHCQECWVCPLSSIRNMGNHWKSFFIYSMCQNHQSCGEPKHQIQILHYEEWQFMSNCIWENCVVQWNDLLNKVKLMRKTLFKIKKWTEWMTSGCMPATLMPSRLCSTSPYYLWWSWGVVSNESHVISPNYFPQNHCFHCDTRHQYQDLDQGSSTWKTVGILARPCFGSHSQQVRGIAGQTFFIIMLTPNFWLPSSLALNPADSSI